VQMEAVKQNPSAIKFFKRAWRKNSVKKMTVAELEEILGHRLEIVSSEGSP
jgi:tRNA G37 N-methylase Trm5